jgi:hypothetical protein
MTLEEYKEFVVQKLGLADDCEETEQQLSLFIHLKPDGDKTLPNGRVHVADHL